MGLLVLDRNQQPPDQKFPFPGSPRLFKAWPGLIHAISSSQQCPATTGQGCEPCSGWCRRQGCKRHRRQGQCPGERSSLPPAAGSICQLCCSLQCHQPLRLGLLLLSTNNVLNAVFYFFFNEVGFSFVFLRQETRHVQLWRSCLSVPSTPRSSF